jgi:hypothetical protein
VLIHRGRVVRGVQNTDVAHGRREVGVPQPALNLRRREAIAGIGRGGVAQVLKRAGVVAKARVLLRLREALGERIRVLVRAIPAREDELRCGPLLPLARHGERRRVRAVLGLHAER